jgi:hypothetical protein
VRAFIHTIKKNPGCAVTRAGAKEHCNNAISIVLRFVAKSELFATTSTTGTDPTGWGHWRATKARHCNSDRRSIRGVADVVLGRLRAQHLASQSS